MVTSRYSLPVQFFAFNPLNHDNESKTIFAGTPYELVTPAGRVGAEGVQDAFDLVASLESHPGTAQFICMKLIGLTFLDYGVHCLEEVGENRTVFALADPWQGRFRVRA